MPYYIFNSNKNYALEKVNDEKGRFFPRLSELFRSLDYVTAKRLGYAPRLMNQ